MKNLILSAIIFLSVNVSGQSIKGFNEYDSGTIIKNPYNTTNLTERCRLIALGNEVIKLYYKINEESLNSDETFFLRGIIEVGKSCYEVIGQQWMADRFDGVLYDPITKKAVGTISCYERDNRMFDFSITWANQAPIDYKLKEIEVKQDMYNFDEQIAKINMTGTLVEARTIENPTAKVIKKEKINRSGIINNLSDLLKVSKLSAYGLTDNLQGIWEIKRPTEKYSKDGKTITGRYTYVYSADGTDQTIQRIITMMAESAYKSERTDFVCNDKELLIRIIENLPYQGFKKLISKPHMTMYDDGKNRIGITDDGYLDDPLSKGFYRISVFLH